MAEEPERFSGGCGSRLRRQVNAAINRLTARGMVFRLWECLFAGNIAGQGRCAQWDRFVPVSVVCAGQYGTSLFWLWIRTVPMGVYFRRSRGFGKSDSIAARVLENVSQLPLRIFYRSWRIIYIGLKRRGKKQVGGRIAGKNSIPGCRGRIEVAGVEWCDTTGRYLLRWCWAENHHDVSEARILLSETSNIYDGSSYTADMAVQNVVGMPSGVQPRYLFITEVALAGAEVINGSSDWW